MSELIDFLVWLNNQYKLQKIDYASLIMVGSTVFDYLVEREKKEVVEE